MNQTITWSQLINSIDKTIKKAKKDKKLKKVLETASKKWINYEPR